MNPTSIQNLSAVISDKLIQIRRHLHKHPELSDQEEQTMLYLSSILHELNIAHSCNVGGYGIVGSINGNNGDGSAILLRADMDALPIEEKNKVDYCSSNKGVMHACGHDVHSTCLLGALMILLQVRDAFSGTVKFVFQPAEEKLPGGAKRMIEAGVLENPRPLAAIALHVFPSLEVGSVGFRTGMYMASCDEIYLTIEGKGGHAAIPAEINNPLYAAAEVLMALEQLAAAYKQSDIPTVLSFGNLQALGATNVVPDVCTLAGTFRTMNEEWRAKCHSEIMQLVEQIAQSRGVFIKCHIEKGYPYLVNDAEVTSIAQSACRDYLGANRVHELDIRMASEDFAYYSQNVPSCFFRLGTGNRAKGITSPVHTATFDIDEDALPIGAGLLAYIAITLLNKH